MTLDDFLALIYQADLKKQKDTAIGDFRMAMLDDVSLMTAAKAKLDELNALIEARGEGACAYSTKYRGYLAEALNL